MSNGGRTPNLLLKVQFVSWLAYRNSRGDARLPPWRRVSIREEGGGRRRRRRRRRGRGAVLGWLLTLTIPTAATTFLRRACIAWEREEVRMHDRTKVTQDYAHATVQPDTSARETTLMRGKISTNFVRCLKRYIASKRTSPSVIAKTSNHPR